VEQSIDLLVKGFYDLRVPLADIQDADPTGEVEIPTALAILDPCAIAADSDAWVVAVTRPHSSVHLLC
jgi:hypothetical protein